MMPTKAVKTYKILDEARQKLEEVADPDYPGMISDIMDVLWEDMTDDERDFLNG